MDHNGPNSKETRDTVILHLASMVQHQHLGLCCAPTLCHSELFTPGDPKDMVA